MDSDNRPLVKRALSRLQYIWRLAIPLWMFRDAGRGTTEQRIANYRYNRSRRNVLPFYVCKWVGIAACLMQLTRLLSDLMRTTAVESTNHLCATLFCVSTGIGFAFSCIVIAVLSTCYLFLTYIEK